jgi:8-oxo-dGTP pyrophosphatase MutT (NUDIX family)
VPRFQCNFYPTPTFFLYAVKVEGALPRAASIMAEITTPNSSPLQVAAVCYRRTGRWVEFLLVRTSSGRWTFPKGRIEDALSLPDVAAMEALEEAGAVGDVNPRPIGTYLHRKESLRGCTTKDVTVVTFLMAVESTDVPAESGRRPRWFSVKEARERLAVGRRGHYRAGIETVIEAALRRIERDHSALIA